jgi:hypothetical protein
LFIPDPKTKCGELKAANSKAEMLPSEVREAFTGQGNQNRTTDCGTTGPQDYETILKAEIPAS